MKKLAALLCGTVIAVSSVCSATVAPEKIAIGKAAPGMLVSELISIYGQPIRQHDDDLVFENFKVEIEDHRPDIVDSIETRSDSISTPDGISVGQNAEVLSQAYGQADRVEVERGKSEYKYYSHDYSKKIEFKVVNGIITKISCEYHD